MYVRTLDERGDALLVLKRLRLLDEIDLVLENDDVFELHDLDGGKMLRCLRLRARLVPCNQQKCGVHDGGTVQHRSHKNVVSGAVDERHMADQLHSVATAGAFARGVVLLVGAVGAIASWSWASLILALVDLYNRSVSWLRRVRVRATHFCIRVAQLDGDVPDEFVLETDGLNA